MFVKNRKEELPRVDFYGHPHLFSDWPPPGHVIVNLEGFEETEKRPAETFEIGSDDSLITGP